MGSLFSGGGGSAPVLITPPPPPDTKDAEMKTAEEAKRRKQLMASQGRASTILNPIETAPALSTRPTLLGSN